MTHALRLCALVCRKFTNSQPFSAKLRSFLVRAVPVILVGLLFVPLASAADPVTSFFTGIKATAEGLTAIVATIGVIICGAIWLFGSGRTAELAMQIGAGCLVLGGVDAIVAWLFGIT
jgi:type IV secretory pathway VirB2 component (pilin)